MKRSTRSLGQAGVLAIGIFLLLAGPGYFHGGNEVKSVDLAQASPPSLEPTDMATFLPDLVSRNGNGAPLAQTPLNILAIIESTDTTLPRLECPFSNEDRYAYLKGSSRTETIIRPKYFLALDLHQCVKLLPRLLSSIVETMRFLGPENCALSIVAGNSDDGTLEVLKQLRSEVEGLGIRYLLQSSEINPMAGGTDRIRALAKLRNLAVKDVMERPESYAQDTTVIFSNDIALCMEDILELVHQRVFQGADMTCAMDWTYVGENPTFYDVWIARGMTGDTFFNIPDDGSWDYAWDLFWNDEKARSRWLASKPFQVFSCWNGITAFTAQPLLEGKIWFRDHYDDECFEGEPKLFAKDMWYHGYGKIAVVPSVNVEYSDEAAKKIKALKGYTSKHVTNDDHDVRIAWETTPPAKVKCMPGGYEHQKFVAWNEGLPHLEAAT